MEKINILQEIDKIDITTIDFENRNNSCNPSIKRLNFGTFYAYVIKFYVGCNCNYLGCEKYKLKDCFLKLRDKETEEIILTKNNTTKLKLEINKNYSVQEIKQLIIKNF